MTRDISDIKEDAAIAILETVFHEEIDLKSSTRPIPGRFNWSKANAINHMKRYVCWRLGIPCHFVRDSSLKHTGLRELIDQHLKELGDLVDWTYQDFVIPDKTEAVKPVEKQWGYDKHQESYFQHMERLNMAGEDIKKQLTDPDDYGIIQSTKKFVEANRARLDAKYQPAETHVIDREGITSIALGYHVSLDENPFEDLLLAVYEDLLAFRGNEEAKEYSKMRRHNMETEQTRKEALALNEARERKYRERQNRIREQKDMFQEEKDSKVNNLIWAHERQCKAIEEENAQKLANYRKELEKIGKLSAENQEQSVLVAEYIANVDNWNMTMSRLDYTVILNAMREAQIADRRSISKAFKKYGIPVNFYQTYQKIFLYEGQMVSSIIPGITDYVIFRNEVMKVILDLEEDKLDPAEFKTPDDCHRVAKRMGYNKLFGNIFIRIMWHCQFWRKNSDYCKPTEDDARRALGLEKKEVTVLQKPILKKPPSRPRDDTLYKKAHLEEPSFTSRKKLKQAEVPKKYMIPYYSLPPVDEIDFFALIYCLVCVDDSRCKNEAKRVFGDIPGFRVHNFRQRHKYFLEQYRVKFWDIYSDWQLNIDPRNKLERELKEQRAIGQQRNLAKTWQSYLRTPAKKYQMKKRLIMNNQVLAQIAQKNVESLDESNKFHSEKKSKGLRLRRKKKTKFLERTRDPDHCYQVTGWDVLENVVVEGQAKKVDSEVLSRIIIRSEARKTIDRIGRACLKSVPTHMLENLFFASCTKNFVPKLDIARGRTERIYWRKARVAFCQSVSRS